MARNINEAQLTPEQFGESHLSNIWDDTDQPGVTKAALDEFRKSRHLCGSPMPGLGKRRSDAKLWI